MCGIVGIVSRSELAPSLAGATSAIRHRGPDDEGIWVGDEGRVALGHRRLSILDLSPEGHGPFVKDDLVMTYNGEVYNYLELRADLEARGHRFRSQTDTEVVLEAYRAFGPAFVERLRGMYALALWDAGKRRLVLARDRLGIKPLYVYRDDERVAFASELKALEQIAGLRLVPDESAAYDFLTYLYVPGPKTIYTNVSKLLPAHVATCEVDREGLRWQARKYWSVDMAAGTGPRGERAVEAARDALRDAVASHLVADVPLGCLLSGGVDSSIVSAFAAERLTEPLRTFSVGFDVEEHSETHFARMVATAFGAAHTERVVDVKLAKSTLSRIGALYDEPFGDLSAIPTLEVCRVARESVTVALSGDGGDEVFGGYSSYTRQARRQRWFGWIPSLFRGDVPSRLAETVIMKVRGAPTVIDGMRDPLERHVVIQGGLSRREKARVLPRSVVKRFDGYDDLWALRAHDRPDLDPITRFQIIDLATYLPDDILVKVDRASMACSLEVRPPLLDHRLIELVATIPPEARNPGGSLKWLLKEVARPHIPRAIIERPKKGFGVPIHTWIEDLGPRVPKISAMGSTLVSTLSGWAKEHDGLGWARDLQP